MAHPTSSRRSILGIVIGSSASGALTLAGTKGSASSAGPTQAGIAEMRYPRTNAESAAAVIPVVYRYPPGNVLRYCLNGVPGTTDVSSGFQASFDQQAKGGAAVYAPAGTYLIVKVVASSNAAPFALHGDGIGRTLIIKDGDADCFVVANSGSAYNQITISQLTISPRSPMSSGAALNLACAGIIPSVTLRDVMILCGGGAVFRFGIKLHNCGEVEMSRVFIYGIRGSAMVGIAVTQSVASTAYKFIGCSIYNVACGASFVNMTSPGIEGIQFYGCDMVAVECGVRYTNSVGAKYFPPQLSWIGGHINASANSFDLSIMCQVFIQGLLSYNSGNLEHIRLQNVSAVSIQGNMFIQTGGTADGIRVGATLKLYGGIIADNTFQMGASGVAINLDTTTMTDLTISANQRVSGSVTVHVRPGILDGSVLILNNSPRDAVDIADTTLMAAARMTLAGIRSDYCCISAPSGVTKCSMLASRRAGDRVTLECHSALLTLQHNEISPDGFLLSGAIDYTFPSTGGRITLEKRIGGYWTEVGRSG